MIQEVLWRIPAIFLSLAILAPATWTLFDHHFIERNPDHDHLVALNTHNHIYDTAYDLHNHDEPSPVGSTSFFAEDSGLVAMASSLGGFCRCSECDSGPTCTYGIVREGEIFPEAVKVPPGLDPPRSGIIA